MRLASFKPNVSLRRSDVMPVRVVASGLPRRSNSVAGPGWRPRDQHLVINVLRVRPNSLDIRHRRPLEEESEPPPEAGRFTRGRHQQWRLAFDDPLRAHTLHHPSPASAANASRSPSVSLTAQDPYGAERLRRSVMSARIRCASLALRSARSKVARARR